MGAPVRLVGEVMEGGGPSWDSCPEREVLTRAGSVGLKAWRAVVPLSFKGAEQAASLEVGCSVPFFCLLGLWCVEGGLAEG